MKKNFCLIFTAMISTGLLADQHAMAPATSSTNAGAITEMPPAAAPAKPVATPARRPAARSAAKKTPELRTVPLVPGPAVVSANRVNVRGKAGIKGEIITRMTNGEPVMVIEEIQLKRSGPEEPSAWAKIALPEKAHAWVHTGFLDTNNLTVKATKLNLRSGPGENFSVLGALQRGESVKELQTKGDWMEVETTNPPFAFMAAQYLKQEPAALITSTEPPPAATAIPENPTIAATTETPVDAMTSTGEVAVATIDMTQPTAPLIEEPLPPRIVDHEGIVRGTISIQAPTKYELISADTHRTINYLHTTSGNLDLSRYKGLHIIVTGEEGLDERWRNTPVITIQKIQVLE